LIILYTKAKAIKTFSHLKLFISHINIVLQFIGSNGQVQMPNNLSLREGSQADVAESGSFFIVA